MKLQEGEEVLAIARKHWFVLFAEAFFLIFVLIFPFLGYAVIHTTGINEVISVAGNITGLMMSLAGIWLLFIWITFFVLWTDYYLDIMIITNHRIIDIEQIGLFSRETATLHLERIQDVTVEVHGLIPTLLDFGDLHIQTAGESREFIAESVPHPAKVKQQVVDVLQPYRRRPQ